MTADISDDDPLLTDCLAVVLELAGLDPVVFDGRDRWCALCEATAPGGATTMTPGQHRGHCVYRLARDIADATSGWNAPPAPPPATTPPATV